MKIREVQGVFGEPVGHELVFTDRERAALARASRIAEEARELCRAHVGGDWEDDPQDMTLAHVEHDARELSEDPRIVLGD